MGDRGGIRRVSRHGGARGGNGGEEYVFLPGTVLGVEGGVWFWFEQRLPEWVGENDWWDAGSSQIG